MMESYHLIVLSDPEEDFENIGISHSCHLDLLENEEYDMVKKEGILLQ